MAVSALAATPAEQSDFRERRGHRDLLCVLLRNLVDNAVRYGPHDEGPGVYARGLRVKVEFHKPLTQVKCQT